MRQINSIAMLALFGCATAAHGANQLGWNPKQHSVVVGSGRAQVQRGDDELDSRDYKMATYRLRSSWHIEDNQRLVLLTSFEAVESGGDHTILKLPTKRTVLYTAPTGLALAEAKITLPPVLATQSESAWAAMGGQEFTMVDWTDPQDFEYCVFFGDRWGKDIDALKYLLQVGYKVRLVKATAIPHPDLTPQLHQPSRPSIEPLRRRHR